MVSPLSIMMEWSVQIIAIAMPDSEIIIQHYSPWIADTSPSIHLVPSFSLSVLFLQISCSLSLGLCCRPSGSARESLDGRLGMNTVGVPIKLLTFGGIPVSPVVTAVEEVVVVESSVVLGSLTTST